MARLPPLQYILRLSRCFEQSPPEPSLGPAQGGPNDLLGSTFMNSRPETGIPLDILSVSIQPNIVSNDAESTNYPPIGTSFNVPVIPNPPATGIPLDILVPSTNSPDIDDKFTLPIQPEITTSFDISSAFTPTEVNVVIPPTQPELGLVITSNGPHHKTSITTPVIFTEPVPQDPSGFDAFNDNIPIDLPSHNIPVTPGNSINNEIPVIAKIPIDESPSPNEPQNIAKIYHDIYGIKFLQDDSAFPGRRAAAPLNLQLPRL